MWALDYRLESDSQLRQQWRSVLILAICLGLITFTQAAHAESPESGLAEALTKTNGEAERDALLAQHKDLVTPKLVTSLIERATQSTNQGNYDQAYARYQVAQAIAERIGDHPGRVRIFQNIGIIHRDRGQFQQALTVFQDGLALAERAGDKLGSARILVSIGDLHATQGDHRQALEHFTTSMSIAESIQDKSVIARALNNIGNIGYFRGNYAEALEHYHRSLRVAEEIGDKAATIRALFNISIVHDAQGNYEQSLELKHKGLAICEAEGNKPAMAMMLRGIGATLLDQLTYERAQSYLEKALAIEESSGRKHGMHVTLINLGQAHQRQKNYTQALAYFERSLAITEVTGNRGATANTLMMIGEVHQLQGRNEKALEFAGRAAALARQSRLSEALWQARLVAGNAYRALNQPDKAREGFEEAISTIELLRYQIAGGEQERQRFFEGKVPPYHAMVELLISQGKAAEALTFAERARSRVLLDVLHSGRVDVTKAMSDREREQERQLNSRLREFNSQIYAENLSAKPDPARLASLQSQVDKARLDSDAFRANLYGAHPELRVKRGEAPPLRPEEGNALLPDTKTALLEFTVAEEKTYLFVLTKDSPVKAFPIAIASKDLTARVERLRFMLANADNRFAGAARELYALLLEPAAEHLKGKTRIVIVPDGPLWELPVQALRTPRGRYLIEDHTIFFTPSLTVLRERITSRTRTTKEGAPALLALGNPALGKETVQRVKSVLMDADLDPLPDAERQVKTLERIYGPGNSKVYIGAEAREERFKAEAKDFRILHLATHGILDNRNPMYSHLLLAETGEAGKEDGLLEARELMNLDLNADLAVLSACETARGRVGQGEGMIGLTWALFVAGVPSTVVSRWKVRSDSTAELMVEFHRQIKTRGSPAAALREASLKLKRSSRYQHPFHWAGFIVVGDGY